MSSQVRISVDGEALVVPVGSTVAVAVALAGRPCRCSVSGESRAPLCGMGICFECRVTINGESHCRSCQIICEPGMDVRTYG